MKRRLIILAATLLSISLLAGCGQAENTGNAETQTTEAATESTTTQEQDVTQTPEPTAEPTPAPTEEPTPAPTEEPTPEPTEEPSPAPTEEPTPAPTEEPTPEPTEEPVVQITYTYTDMTTTMYATQTVNIRNLPSTDGDKIGSLSTNQEVAVTGQCNETGWYRFDYNGQTAFVSDKYLSTEMVEVAPPAQSADNGSGDSDGGNVLANVPNAFTVERGVVHDMGVYRFVICSYYDYDAIHKLNPYGAQGNHLNTSEDLWVFYECDNYYDPGYRAFIDTYTCNCSDADHNGLYPERLGN